MVRIDIFVSNLTFIRRGCRSRARSPSYLKIKAHKNLLNLKICLKFQDYILAPMMMPESNRQNSSLVPIYNVTVANRTV